MLVTCRRIGMRGRIAFAGFGVSWIIGIRVFHPLRSRLRPAERWATAGATIRAIVEIARIKVHLTFNDAVITKLWVKIVFYSFSTEWSRPPSHLDAFSLVLGARAKENLLYRDGLCRFLLTASSYFFANWKLSLGGSEPCFGVEFPGVLQNFFSPEFVLKNLYQSSLDLSIHKFI